MLNVAEKKRVLGQKTVAKEEQSIHMTAGDKLCLEAPMANVIVPETLQLGVVRGEDGRNRQERDHNAQSGCGG